MKREIKFRAYDSKNKKWLNAVPSLEYLLDDPDGSVSHHDIDEEMGLYFYPKYPLKNDFGGRIIYQQFTGLFDKNEREIYEGDIVKRTIHLGFGELQTEFKEIAFNPYNGYGVKEGITDIPFGWLWEVIGNIYENPDLLKLRI